MSKIWACYSVYNAEDYLRASIETIIKYVDYVLIVDGRYENYGEGLYSSTDDTHRIIERLLSEYPYKIFYSESLEGHTQVSKRNLYMNMVPVDDWIFVIDHDEFMFGNNQHLRDEISRYEAEGHRIIRFKQEEMNGSILLRAKLFRKVEGLAYRGYHFNINTPDDHRSWKSILSDNAPIINCTRFIHLSTDMRADRVREDKETFAELRMAIETPEWIVDKQIEHWRRIISLFDEEHNNKKEEARQLYLEEKKWSGL